MYRERELRVVTGYDALSDKWPIHVHIAAKGKRRRGWRANGSPTRKLRRSMRASRCAWRRLIRMMPRRNASLPRPILSVVHHDSMSRKWKGIKKMQYPYARQKGKQRTHDFTLELDRDASGICRYDTKVHWHGHFKGEHVGCPLLPPIQRQRR